MHEAFVFDKRLGVNILREDLDWTQFSEQERSSILTRWAIMCSGMTNRVQDLEVDIMEKLDAMYRANDEDEMHRLNTEMMEIASIVCDLNILSRSVYADLAKAHF
ncbi:hypothetical protein [Tumebacillus permanentifrigoris]|uniref:Uncharacterized protein n=1 Tax=Tumebacillus permanentifrigoris TaxID=378543 RepID=A0A316D6Y4_9BACL|nr:hypothetical protein [Tumebacillus permanentifrigoris]PWK11216.1 hypothetical protein C7459_1119 [Tumebacillus permanentifrigoris]